MPGETQQEMEADLLDSEEKAHHAKERETGKVTLNEPAAQHSVLEDVSVEGVSEDLEAEVREAEDSEQELFGDLRNIHEHGYEEEPEEGEDEQEPEEGEDEEEIARALAEKLLSGQPSSQAVLIARTITAGVVKLSAGGGTDQPPRVGPIADPELERIEATFVEPKDYPRQLAANESIGRVFFVYGPRHTGRWTCALKLSQDLAAGREVCQLLPSSPRLADAIAHGEVRRKSVVILRDCLENGISMNDLRSGLDLVKVHLTIKGLTLILTGDLEESVVRDLSVIPVDPRMPPDKLLLVFKKNLRYMLSWQELPTWEVEERVEAAAAQWKNVSSLLKTSFHVHAVCERLARADVNFSNHELLKESLKTFAIGVSALKNQDVRVWFNQELHANEQLLAILLYLFSGAERRWLEEMHRELIRWFLSRGVQRFDDPRERGLEDSLSALQARDRGGLLQFEHRQHEIEIQWQIGNWQHLVWEALEHLLEDLLSGSPWPDSRQALGRALGKAGGFDLERFRSALKKLASASKWSHRVVAAYAIQEVVRTESPEQIKLADRFLSDWARSRESRLMWTVGATAWRVYLLALGSDRDDILGMSLRHLRVLGERLNCFDLRKEGIREKTWSELFRCIVDAMQRIALSDPQRAVNELSTWLTGRYRHLPSLGRITARTIFEKVSLDHAMTGGQQGSSFFRLVVPLLAAATQESHDVQVTFLALRAWMRWPVQVVSLHCELLRAATWERRETRKRLRLSLSALWLDRLPDLAEQVAKKALKSETAGPKVPQGKVDSLVRYWLEETEEEAHLLGQAVIARCLAMDGILPRLPDVGRVIVAFDPQLLAPQWRDEGVQTFVWEVLALLATRMDVALVRFGEGRDETGLETDDVYVDLGSWFPCHPLIMPGIEAAKGGEPASVVLISERSPHDVGELAATCWIEDVFWIRFGERDKESGSVTRVVQVAATPTPRDFTRVESMFEEHWARALATAPAWRWLETLDELDISTADLTNVEDLLESWLTEEALFPSWFEVRGGEDSVLKILALVHWYAAENLASCLELVRSWLTEDQDGSESLRRALGAAAAFSLIRLHTSYPASAEGRAPTLLFEKLAEPLSAYELDGARDGVEAVTLLVEHWLEDPVWAEYLAGGVQEGRGRLLRWGESNIDDQGLLNRMLNRLSCALPIDPALDAWASLVGTVHRLEAYLDAGRPEALLDLGEEQRYGIVIVDPRSPRCRQLASDIYERLSPQDGSPIVPVIFRLGEKQPVWGENPMPPSTDYLGRSRVDLAPLLGPLLSSLHGVRSKVSFVLLLANDPPLDLEDWTETRWWSVVRTYSAEDRWATARLVAVATPGHTDEEHRVRELEEARLLVTRLSNDLSTEIQPTEGSAWSR